MNPPAREPGHCAAGRVSTVPRGLLASLSLLFSSLRGGKSKGKKVVSPAPGGPAHSKIPAFKCSWQLFKIGKCVCVKSSFPGVGRGGMKPGGLDARLSHRQAAPPWSKWPRQSQTQAQHAAGRGSLLQGSGHCIKPSAKRWAHAVPRAWLHLTHWTGMLSSRPAPGEGHHGSLGVVIVQEHEVAS